MQLKGLACCHVLLGVLLSLVGLTALPGCPEKRSSASRPGVKSVFGPGPNLIKDGPAQIATVAPPTIQQPVPADSRKPQANKPSATLKTTPSRPGVKSLFGPGPTLLDPDPQPTRVTPRPTDVKVTTSVSSLTTHIDPVDGPIIITSTSSEITTNLTVTTDDPKLQKRSFTYKTIRTLDTRRNRQIQERQQGKPTRWLEALRSHDGRAVTKSTQSPMDIKPMPDPLLDAPLLIQVINGRVQAQLSQGTPTPAQAQALRKLTNSPAAYDGTFSDGPRSAGETWTVNRSTLRADNLVPEFVASEARTINRYLRNARYDGQSCALIERTVTIQGRYNVDGISSIPATLTLEGQCYIALNDGLVVQATYQLSLSGGGDVTMDNLNVKTHLEGEGLIKLRENTR